MSCVKFVTSLRGDKKAGMYMASSHPTFKLGINIYSSPVPYLPITFFAFLDLFTCDCKWSIPNLRPKSNVGLRQHLAPSRHTLALRRTMIL